MARCFLLEVNNRGVENHLLCTINPLHFLNAGLLEGPVICDGLAEKEQSAGTDVRENSNCKGCRKPRLFSKNSDFARPSTVCLTAVKPVETP